MSERAHPDLKKSYAQPAALLLICLSILVVAMALASAVQKNFGRVQVSNVTYRNFNGFIPLVGPGGMFVFFVINLFHIMGVLIVVIPVSTWLFQLTGKIYLGAMTSAALVSWMFASSQVIAPIPI